uniref:Uncharacterized protein n=1 Tax=Meloidogyne enterolobii TaxID=390850 RepID=A0A6V7U490_MELEN|nr:unnamed protein product [Meloidogyne enterolobii]
MWDDKRANNKLNYNTKITKSQNLSSYSTFYFSSCSGHLQCIQQFTTRQIARPDLGSHLLITACP